MKKKILSLLLVVSLMIAFTVTSFAYERFDSLNLSEGVLLAKGYYIGPDTFEKGARISIDFLVTDDSGIYSIRIVDRTADRTIYESIQTGDFHGHDLGGELIPGHSYRVWVERESSNHVKGLIHIRAW